MSVACRPMPGLTAHDTGFARPVRLAAVVLPSQAPPPVLSHWAHTLPADCRTRIARLRRPADQARATLAHAAVRRLLAASAAHAGHLEVVRAPSGQPLVLCNGAASDWHVSLAHSGRYVAVAVADHPVGIDLEDAQAWQPRSADELAALSEACLSPNERGNGPQNTLDFLRCWTAKEAVLKAVGLGAAGPWHAFDVGRDPTPGHFLPIDTTVRALDGAHVARFSADPHCPAALCILGPPPTRWAVRRWRLDDLDEARLSALAPADAVPLH